MAKRGAGSEGEGPSWASSAANDHGAAMGGRWELGALACVKAFHNVGDSDSDDSDDADIDDDADAADDD